MKKEEALASMESLVPIRVNNDEETCQPVQLQFSNELVRACTSLYELVTLLATSEGITRREA